MSRDCPEFQWGNAQGSRHNTKVLNNEDGIAFVDGGGEDTVAGQGVILTLDLDPSSPSSEAEPLRRVDLTHDLDQFGRACPGKGNGLCHPAGVVMALIWLPGVSRGDTPGYSNGIPPGCAQLNAPESRGDFSSHDAGGEWVMPRNCPEIEEGGRGRRGGVVALPMHRERSPRPGRLRGGLEHDEEPWGLRRGVDTTDGGWVGMRRMVKWGWGFVWQDAGGERVMRHQCPELSNRSGSAPSGTPRCHLSARGGEATVSGQRGILTLDLDPFSVVPHAGRRVDLNHNLVLSGPARPGKGNPSESGWSFVLEIIRDEMLTRRSCPEFARDGGGRGDGGKALPMYRERSPRPGGIRGGLEHDEHPWGLRRGVDTADGGWVGMRRWSKLEWGFVWQDAGEEWVIAMKCPEITRIVTGRLTAWDEDAGTPPGCWGYWDGYPVVSLRSTTGYKLGSLQLPQTIPHAGRGNQIPEFLE